MTTVTFFGIAGPFSAMSPLPHDGNGVYIVDKVCGTPIVLPRGHIITELAIRRRGTENDPDLTAGKSVAIGLERDPMMGDPATDPRMFTGTPGILTDDLNDDTVLDPNNNNDPRRPFRAFQINLNATTTPNGVHRANTRDRPLVCQCALGNEIDQGSLSFIIKCKPFSSSVAKRFG